MYRCGRGQLHNGVVPSPCPECRATYADGDSCQNRFDRALALEFTDPAFGAVHHLTVTAFMLQHDRYSHQGFGIARSLLERFVSGELIPERARRVPVPETSITRGPRFDRFAEIEWTRTIADVSFDDADTYRSDVEGWARAAVADTRAVTAA